MLLRSLCTLSLVMALASVNSAAPEANVAGPTVIRSSALGTADSDGWDLGPFVKRRQPILRPTPNSGFQCPIRKEQTRH